jgi:CheY-like chemotaxis protein
MPELDGMGTMKVIKGLEGYKIPRIVALTANAVAGAREYYLKEGFDEYLSKPIDTHELDKIITKFLKNKQ